MKYPTFCAALGATGGAIAAAFGGWDFSLNVLLSFMGLDYVTGLIVAGVFHKSDKSENGALESRAGFKGLLRKGAALLIVYVACQLDSLMGTGFIRDSVVTAFLVNETLSIIENAGLMGVPIPEALTKSVEILKRKADGDGEGGAPNG